MLHGVSWKLAGASIALFALSLVPAVAIAGDEHLEFKLVTIAIDSKALPIAFMEGRTVSTAKLFGVAYFKDGRVAVKDFVGQADTVKGIGSYNGFSTYTFEDGSTLNLTYVAKATSTGFHGDYTVVSGTGSYNGATGKGVLDGVTTKWTDGAFLYNVGIDVHTP